VTDSGMLAYLLGTREVAHQMIDDPNANNFEPCFFSFRLQDRSALVRVLWFSFVPVFGPAAVLKCFRINSNKHLLASSCLFFRQSVHVLQRGSYCTEFRETLYCGLLRKSVEKLQIWLKSETKIRCFI